MYLTVAVGQWRCWSFRKGIDQIARKERAKPANPCVVGCVHDTQENTAIIPLL